MWQMVLSEIRGGAAFLNDLLRRPTRVIDELVREGSAQRFLVLSLAYGVLKVAAWVAMAPQALQTVPSVMGGAAFRADDPAWRLVSLLLQIILAGPVECIGVSFFLVLVASWLGAPLVDQFSTAMVVLVSYIPAILRGALGLVLGGVHVLVPTTPFQLGGASPVFAQCWFYLGLGTWIWGMVLLVKGLSWLYNFSTGKAIGCMLLANVVRLILSAMLGTLTMGI